MKLIYKLIIAAVVIVMFSQNIALASSHREAPLISNDPLADNTDLYAFRSPCDSNNVVLIANYIPFEHPAGGPNWYTFGEDIRYEIHIDNDPSTMGDDIVYRFTFKQINEDPTTFFNIRLGKQNIKTTYTLERSMNGGRSFSVVITDGVVPPPNIGPRSITNPTVGLGAPDYNSLMMAAVTTASSGEKVFCGPVDDPFFVDLGGAFDLGGFRPNGPDGLAKFNCHSIVIEVPISTLQKDGKSTAQAANILDGDFVIGVYASASRPKITTLSTEGEKSTYSGNWIQVSRLGMPLTNEVVIPIGDKDKWNGTMPADDLQFAKYFTNPELALYMDDSKFGGAVPGLSALRIQTNSLGAFDFRNGAPGLFPLKGSPALDGTALSEANFGSILLPDNSSPRAVDLLPIFYTGVPNLRPYQLATGKNGDPLAAGKPFINNFLPTLGDYLRLNMAVPVTPRNSPDFSSLGIVQAAVLGLTDPRFNGDASLQFIPNMDGFPNGRRLEDDVTTIELQAVSGIALAAIGLWYDDFEPGVSPSPVTQDLLDVLTFNAGVTKNDTTFKACFPYLQTPWAGFRGKEYVGECVTPACSIVAIPENDIFTGGIPTNIYIGYGPQSVTLKPTATNGTNFTYKWSGPAGLSCTDCEMPVFTPTMPGSYTFTVTTTNELGCSSTCEITICVTDIRVTGSKGTKVWVCFRTFANNFEGTPRAIRVVTLPERFRPGTLYSLGMCDVPCSTTGGSSSNTQKAAKNIIDEDVDELKVTVAPNPSAGAFTLIISSKQPEPVKVRVMDMSGNVLTNLQNVQPNTSIRTGDNLSTGMYIAEITQNRQRVVVKLLKTK